MGKDGLFFTKMKKSKWNENIQQKYWQDKVVKASKMKKELKKNCSSDDDHSYSDNSRRYMFGMFGWNTEIFFPFQQKKRCGYFLKQSESAHITWSSSIFFSGDVCTCIVCFSKKGHFSRNKNHTTTTKSDR